MDRKLKQIRSGGLEVKHIAVCLAILFSCCALLRAQSNRVRLIEGETSVHLQSGRDNSTTSSGDRGKADLDGVEFEVEFKIQVRGSASALFEQSRLAGLRGICEIFVDGEPASKIKMESGRMQTSILGGLLDSTLNQLFEGQADPPDTDFSSESNKAEWSRVVTCNGVNYTVLVRFVYRESSNVLKYYVFVEKPGAGNPIL